MKINHWVGKNVFITGINGFIGGNLCKKLISEGANIFGLIRNISKDNFISYEGLTDHVVLIQGELNDKDLLCRIISEEQINDPCGSYTSKMVIGAGNSPNAGEYFLQLGETGGCTSDGEEENINNRSWISFNTSTAKFELIDATKSNLPVNWVKWYGAYAFSKYYNVGLPTEAQWEYAARGGLQLEYPTDDGTLDMTKANYNGDTPGFYNPDRYCVEVGLYPANPYGLYDMGGNVWEWCQDYYSESFYTDGVEDPLNIFEGTSSKRVRRGGSWNYHSTTLLTYARASDFEYRGNNHFGFRIVN